MEAELVNRRIVAAVALACLPVVATGASAEGDVRVVLKFVKRDGRTPAIRFDPVSCPACRVLDEPLFAADNPRETVIALRVPRMRTIELTFDGQPGTISQVLLEAGDLAFRHDGGRIVVPLPPLTHDAITAAEVATHIVEPGMVLRFEHADPARRAGAYATGAFPERERRAADVLEFAQREVVRTLGLGEEALRRGWGTIQIMGFDTNAPHGHVDAPPHIHMHLRWPGDTGTQIGHYYLDASGLLSHNVVGVKGLGMPDRRFGRGETFTTIAPDGSTAYTHRITDRGWLEIADGGGRTCTIRPASGIGFAEGAIVACPNDREQPITVRDDLKTGILTVTTGAAVETFRYTPATGLLLSPTTAPSPAPSVAQPQTGIGPVR
ncbi:hypothetical protein [Sphingomonas sp. PP-CC-3G-468]|uniref:hypothetical protein n=1 Tax=Sphingomonas sp. PP-CC-3G-468 TaxID=2135656 RepID=UPI0010E0DAAF|nr:hypothetical protein [Sphingomonas sp. PP-CC-3G-468]TCM04711.1 hypothetical protein C8J41_1087 [Sphingomonas sp. PP-CC-3G-468]